MKICAYGWGYGGYLTSMLLTKDSVESPTFHCYVAVAPIVSFQYYSEYISLVWVEWTSRIIECQFSQFPFSHSAQHPSSPRNISAITKCSAIRYRKPTCHCRPPIFCQRTICWYTARQTRSYISSTWCDWQSRWYRRVSFFDIRWVHEEFESLTLCVDFDTLCLTLIFWPFFTPFSSSQVYTDEDHELNGVIYHVHKTIESYLDDSFGSLDTKEAWEDPVFALFANRDWTGDGVRKCENLIAIRNVLNSLSHHPLQQKTKSPSSHEKHQIEVERW